MKWSLLIISLYLIFWPSKAEWEVEWEEGMNQKNDYPMNQKINYPDRPLSKGIEELFLEPNAEGLKGKFSHESKTNVVNFLKFEVDSLGSPDYSSPVPLRSFFHRLGLKRDTVIQAIGWANIEDGLVAGSILINAVIILQLRMEHE